LRVSEHEKPRQLTLSEAETQVREDYLATIARTKVTTIGEQAYKALTEGATASELAETFHFEWHASTKVIRAVKGVPQEILRRAFSMPPATDDTPTTSTLNLLNGDFSIVVLTKVSPAEQKMSAQEKLRFRQSLSSFSGQNQFEALTKVLRENSEIRVY